MFDDTGGYLQQMVVLKRNMMTNPIFRCNQLLDLSLPSVQNSGPSWRFVFHLILFLFCRPATKKTSRSAFRCTRAEIKRATCLSCLTQSWCHHRPWTCHGPAGQGWTCDSSNSGLDKSISFVGNLRIEQDSPDLLQVGTPKGPYTRQISRVEGSCECTAYNIL